MDFNCWQNRRQGDIPYRVQIGCDTYLVFRLKYRNYAALRKQSDIW